MNQRGFMPFSAAGIAVLMLVVALVGHAAWSRHQRSLSSIESAGGTSVLTAVASIQNDLWHVARYAVYRALWEVSKNAENYPGEEARTRAIERLAENYFSEFATDLPDIYRRLDARVELELPDQEAPAQPYPSLSPRGFFSWLTSVGARPSFRLHQTENGFVLAVVTLPKGARVRASSWDNSLVLTLPFENFDVFIDSRYFLLQERMDRFIDGIPELDGIGSTWWVAEYTAAWSQALAGKVQLSEKRSRAFFELAWARHEYDTFGSADYLATSTKLLGLGGDAKPALDRNQSAAEITLPVSAAEVEKMISRIDGCISSIDNAGFELVGAAEHVRRAAGYARENSPENVRLELNCAIEGVGRAKGEVWEVSQDFDGLLNDIASAAEGNELLKQLYRGLTESNGAYPVLGQQVSRGVQGILCELAHLENLVGSCLRQVGDDLASRENALAALRKEVETQVQNLLTTSAPHYLFENEYPGPEDYNPESEPAPILRKIEVYTIDGSSASLGTLRAILANAKSDFERMRELAAIADDTREKLGGVNIDGALHEKLLPDAGSELPNSLSRESLYEILPPPPISSQPGLSVFHDFQITSVEYERRDPRGRWFGGEAAPPTRIPLWFIGLDIYWAQWRVSLEVGDGAVEELFDFDNPALPRQHTLFGAGGQIADVHKPLAYRCEMPKRRFSFTLVIVLPWRKFSIAAPDMMSR